MPHIKKNLITYGLFVSVVAVLALTTGLFSGPNPWSPPVTHAACTGGGVGGTSTTFSGYAWSGTIGWICMGTASCANANVTVQSDNTITGYAWSDHVGWIQFGGLSSFPSGPGTQAVDAQISGSNLTGWAKATQANGNGWDGWISLKGTGYGPTISGSASPFPLTGYAWGSDVVGWIDFSAVTKVDQSTGPPTPFTPSFTANPPRIRKGGNTALSWSATCMSSCSVRDQNNTLVGSGLTANNLSVGPINNPTTYTLTCLDASAGTHTATAGVTLVPSVREI